jgi:shikimate kinase
VIYLRARLDRLWERTRHDSSRPLLATPDPKATLADLLEQREPLYLECAHLVVDTGAQSATALAGRIALQLRGSQAAGVPA